MIKILIVDDHTIVRQGLKQIIAEEKDMAVLGEAGNAAELYSILNKEKWDIIILDINMPGKSGLEILKDLSFSAPAIPVLILSMYSEEQYGIRALKAGASGYLPKAIASEEFVKAIRIIVGGGKYIKENLTNKLIQNITVPDSNCILSDRELEILCNIASGKTAEEIADNLSISIHTVYTYRNRVMEKLCLKSNVEITQYAIQRKLITL